MPIGTGYSPSARSVPLRLALLVGTPHFCAYRNAVHVFSTDQWARKIEIAPNVYIEDKAYDGRL